MPQGDWSPERKRFAEQVGLLVKALQSTDEQVQGLAVAQISLMGPKVVPRLISTLEEELDEIDVRQSGGESTASNERRIAGICDALGIIRDSDAIVDLASALPRKEAIEALSKIGGDRALELILDAIEGEPGRGGGHSSWTSSSADTDPAFVRHVFLRFGEPGKKRLEKELAATSGSKRAAVAEILRIVGWSP